MVHGLSGLHGALARSRAAMDIRNEPEHARTRLLATVEQTVWGSLRKTWHAMNEDAQVGKRDNNHTFSS